MYKSWRLLSYTGFGSLVVEYSGYSNSKAPIKRAYLFVYVFYCYCHWTPLVIVKILIFSLCVSQHVHTNDNESVKI